nr:calcium-binding protein [Gloeocapsopsis dulcis]
MILFNGTSGENATGNALNNKITGNDYNNTVDGKAGADILDGGVGTDTLIGGLGNDTYIVDHAYDVAIENAREGTDTYHSTATSFAMDANVENLVMFSGAVSAYGTSINNVMTGNSASNTLDSGGGNDTLFGKLGNDTLIGGAGNDTLVGDAGADVLTGGSGKDTFYFESRSQGIDKITDFSVIDDTIQVSRSGFGGGLVAGKAISAAQFTIGSSAGDSSDRFIYNKNTGGLFFDADGKGGSGQTQLATLSPSLGLTNADIFVIA